VTDERHELTDEQKRELDEMAKRFSETIGDGSRQESASPDSAETKGGSK
jgi:hypothetical protein